MLLRLPALVISLAFAAGPALAQTTLPDEAPIPSDGVLVPGDAGVPIGDQIDTGGLPGVTFEDTEVDRSPRGPGGLQNNVGAAGTNTPGTSGYNPALETPLPDGQGVPLVQPQPQ